MIKVNLLRDQTVRVRRNLSFTKPTVSRTGLIFAAIFILVAGGMGAWWFYLDKQIANDTEKLNDLRIKEARLQELKKEIAKFEKMTQLRLSRINVIEKLKEAQTGPVTLLNQVLQSLPQDGILWLTNLTQKEDQVRIVGFAQRTEAIPDFMSNLAANGFFQAVDLESIESQKDASKFSLLCLSAKKKQAE
jgi:Tfp pilus assembly protein PilN